MQEIALPNAEQLDRIIALMGGDTGIYGVRWNKLEDELIRVMDAKNLEQPDFDSIYPWAGMRRCIVDNDVNVVAYHGDPNYVEDGSIGQVMVEIPKFYYRAFKTSKGYQWEISPEPKTGFAIHPAFITARGVVDYIYFSAYEGSVFDVSENVYLYEDEQIADFSTDMLSSVANTKPCSGETQLLTIVNSRRLANNRGVRWLQQDFTSSSAIQLLFLIEYASFDTQGKIGRGITSKTSGTGNEAEKTGQTSNLGNSSGMADGDNGYVSVSYRGIENFWGNIFTWVDGLNIKADNLPYWATDEYTSNKYDGNFNFAGGELSNVNGYVSDILFDSNFNFGFLPTEVKGSSNSKLYDYYYQGTGNRVARLGGYWYYGLDAGGFCWGLTTSSGYRTRNIGARLLCK
jgi:hypothetical protein